VNQARQLEFGLFPVPYADDVSDIARQVELAESLGLELVGIQDHPYQRRYLDTFTLLPWLVARTDRIRFFPDVTHLPLRPPAMLAKAVASLDVLSGGRIELGLGSGGFLDASHAMGAPSLSRRDAHEALEEAIGILRQFWDAQQRGIRHDGEHYRLGGAKAGPPPAHDIGIWIGGGGPRTLQLIAREADGWIPPSIVDLGRDRLLAKQRELDQAIDEAGRDRAEVRRILNVAGTITDGPAEGWFTGPMDHWVDELGSLADEGFDTFVFWPTDGTDDQLHAFAEVADRLRTRVSETGP
jgi:alkanesulfonate monooxygenase SsuD/methylene tetrahydromethanopterin reductase-like flavin-dependent oxidoreductase (luciferase family)